MCFSYYYFFFFRTQTSLAHEIIASPKVQSLAKSSNDGGNSQQKHEEIDEELEEINLLHLDLDCCIPQWMKDNFSKGIYPTLEERNSFSKGACEYVLSEAKSHFNDFPKDSCVDEGRSGIMISFSFVNHDIRDFFLQYFKATISTGINQKVNFCIHWLLINTTADEANRRISQREDHFYENLAPESSDDDKTKAQKELEKAEGIEEENSEWDFAPVHFDHLDLDGLTSLPDNAEIAIDFMIQTLSE